jgi:2-oxoisovalerate dehydrogenase E1 component beta subunit
MRAALLARRALRLRPRASAAAAAAAAAAATPALAAPRRGASAVPATGGRQLNLFQAINDALAVALERHESATVFGEDVAFGGVFRCTMNLRERFGSHRVFNTPLTEQGVRALSRAARARSP